MKKTVRVTIEKEYEIELAPELLTQEFIDEFESYMFELGGDDLGEKQDSLFKFAAQQITEHNGHFIDGLGEPANYLYGRSANVVYKEIEYWVDSEIVE